MKNTLRQFRRLKSPTRKNAQSKSKNTVLHDQTEKERDEFDTLTSTLSKNDCTELRTVLTKHNNNVLAMTVSQFQERLRKAKTRFLPEENEYRVHVTMLTPSDSAHKSQGEAERIVCQLLAPDYRSTVTILNDIAALSKKSSSTSATVKSAVIAKYPGVIRWVRHVVGYLELLMKNSDTNMTFINFVKRHRASLSFLTLNNCTAKQRVDLIRRCVKLFLRFRHRKARGGKMNEEGIIPGTVLFVVSVFLFKEAFILYAVFALLFSIICFVLPS